MAEEDHEQILAAASRDARALTDLPAHAEQGGDVEQRHEVHEPAETARLAHRLGVLAEGVARHEIGDDAQPHVVETAEDSVLPRHGDSSEEIACGWCQVSF